MNTALQLTLIEAVGDYSAKVGQPIPSYGAYLVLSQRLQDYFAHDSTASIAIVNAYWDGFSNLMTMGMGWLMGEQLSARQWAGCALISAGIFFLSEK